MNEIPRKLVLRKSLGPYSAGTPVAKCVGVPVIDGSLITMLRSRTDIVPVENKRARRLKTGKQQVYEMLFGDSAKGTK